MTPSAREAPLAELPVVDPSDPRFWQDVHGPLAAALERSPVARTPEGARLVLGAAEVEQVLRDPRMRTVDLLARGGITDGPLHEWWSKVMFSTDPPEHTRLRRLVSRAFTPRRVDELRPTVEALAHELAADVRSATAGGATVDLIEAFAHRLPIRVMASMLAIPAGDEEQFARWTADLGLVFSTLVDPGLRARLEATILQLGDYTRGLVERRRADPGEDLLSALIAVEDDGPPADAAGPSEGRLRPDELVAMVQNLLFAGHDTSRSLLQIAAWIALRDGGRLGRSLLVDDTEAGGATAAAFVEEVLRVEPPVFGSARCPTTDLDLGGVVLPAGPPVSVALPAANRDPRRYPDPHRFDPDRFVPVAGVAALPAPILSFGGGVHHCLGAALARAEATIALPILLRAVPGLELAEEPRWVPYAHIRRFERLLVRAGR